LRPYSVLGRLLWPVLRIPLFHKIALANGVLLVIGLSVGYSLSSATSEPITVPLVVAIIVAATVVNVLLTRTALGPIHSLQRTALEVEAGHSDARATNSQVADREVAGLVRVFNRMLDRQSETRGRERDRAHRALRAMDAEHTRTSRELYDDLAQTLAGVLLRLRLLDRDSSLGEASPETRRIVNEVREQVLQALEGVRGVARRLYPPELQELGLQSAIEALARTVSDATGLDIQVQTDKALRRLDAPVDLTVFRIVQEALSNAADHANAGRAWVELAIDEDELQVDVCDDGLGFDPALTLDHAKGFGLAAVMERAAQVGGRVTIESRLGQGTRVQLRIPVSRPEDMAGEPTDVLITGSRARP
jgi:two-component system sensor histidine kinase UhpB